MKNHSEFIEISFWDFRVRCPTAIIYFTRIKWGYYSHGRIVDEVMYCIYSAYVLMCDDVVSFIISFTQYRYVYRMIRFTRDIFYQIFQTLLLILKFLQWQQAFKSPYSIKQNIFRSLSIYNHHIFSSLCELWVLKVYLGECYSEGQVHHRMLSLLHRSSKL